LIIQKLEILNNAQRFTQEKYPVRKRNKNRLKYNIFSREENYFEQKKLFKVQ